MAGTAFSYNNGVSNNIGEGHGDFTFYNYKGEEQYPDYTKIYADILFKYNGFSLLAEYLNTSASALEGSYVNPAATSLLYTGQISNYLVLGDAANVQACYVTNTGYSLDLRYEKLTPEFESALSVLNNQEAYTLGLAKYFKGNDLKVQTSFMSLKTDAGDSFAAQLLLQLVF